MKKYLAVFLVQIFMPPYKNRKKNIWLQSNFRLIQQDTQQVNSAPLPLAPAILGTGSGGCTHILGNYFLIVPHFSLSIRAEQCASTEVIKRSVDLYTVVTMNPGLTINKDVCRKIVNTVSAPAAIGPYNQVILIIGCSPPHSYRHWSQTGGSN